MASLKLFFTSEAPVAYRTMEACSREFMHNGQGILLDFELNPSLKSFAGEYSDRIRYISGNAKDRLGLSAVLIRPDGIIAWAADNDPDCSELREAAAKWFDLQQPIIIQFYSLNSTNTVGSFAFVILARPEEDGAMPECLAM